MNEFKPIEDLSLDELLKMSDEDLEKMAEHYENNTGAAYYCSQGAVEFMKENEPMDLETFFDYNDLPEEYILIRNEAGNMIYLMCASDFLEDSEVLLEGNNSITIENFENGIPAWLNPKADVTYYRCERDEDAWTFHEVKQQ